MADNKIKSGSARVVFWVLAAVLAVLAVGTATSITDNFMAFALVVGALIGFSELGVKSLTKLSNLKKFGLLQQFTLWTSLAALLVGVGMFWPALQVTFLADITPWILGALSLMVFLETMR